MGKKGKRTDDEARLFSKHYNPNWAKRKPEILSPGLKYTSNAPPINRYNGQGKENNIKSFPSASSKMTAAPTTRPKVVYLHRGLGNDRKRPGCTQTLSSTSSLEPSSDADNNAGHNEVGLNISWSFYQHSRVSNLSWYNGFQVQNLATNFPLASAKVVASKAQEIARWASAINPDFSQVVLNEIGAIDLNQSNLTSFDTSPFAIACLQGDVATVQRAIEAICTSLEPPYSRQIKLRLLLEAHESGQWSPLLLISCAMIEDKGEVPNPSLITIATLLLRAGARPDAQDAMGKSIIHYAAGCNATPMSMRLVDMCISASKSVDLYGKEVVLDGFTNSGMKYMNGKKGIVGGYDYLTDQRSVFIPSFGKEIWVQAENICLANGKARDMAPKLVDLQDNEGDTPIHVIMRSNHKDIGHSLLHKYQASIYIQNNAGISPVMMTLGQPFHPPCSLSQMIGEFTRSKAEKARNVCANCSKSLGWGGMKCSKCLVTFYCCSTCQTKHWEEGGHKLACKKLVSSACGVKLESKHLDRKTIAGLSDDSFGDYVKPVEVKIGKKFVVAVQINPDTQSLMIFSVCNGCQFQYKPTGPGYTEVAAAVLREPAWNGCKTYMKASFDSDGECTMYPATAGVKRKYRW